MAIQAPGGPEAHAPIARAFATGAWPVRVRGVDRARTSGGLVIVLELTAGTGGSLGLQISPADHLRVERELAAGSYEASVYETLAATIRARGGRADRRPPGPKPRRVPDGVARCGVRRAPGARGLPPTDAVLLATRRGAPLFASESALAPTRAPAGAARRS